ncbi:MAG: ABC transporter permease [Deltaproteobacteria bacterium]|nr:ABC transporter permease [Deltaproteobacteria bacterium]
MEIASRSPWQDAWQRLCKNRMALACGALFLLISMFSFVGPLAAKALLGVDGKTQDVLLGAAPPSWRHWLGTDALGRDLLVRAMDGGRIAISVGLLAAGIALLIGVTWGAVAAYVGGKVDEVMMRIVDAMYSLPSTLFVIVVMAMFETRSIYWLFGLIGAVSWLTMARIVRGQVLSLRHREFVEAARALGVPPLRIIVGHVIPNTLGPVIVYTTLTIPGVMLQEAFLSFLGLGVQAPRASWGTLVAEGAQQMLVYPWILLGPGLLMTVTILCLNFLGDGLRDALDPQAR